MEIINKVWGFNPSKLTPSGVSRLFTDILTMVICLMFIGYFPPAPTQEYMLQWLGAAGLLLIMIYGFLPSMTRVFFGNYEHYIDEEKEE